jgi:short-subunit dehydrogenase
VARSAALITGASSGIGAELAKLCAAAGKDLILVARRDGELQSLAAALAARHGIQASALAADLSDPAAPLYIFQSVQSSGAEVDILINNAGFGLLGPFSQTNWQLEAAMIQVNVTAVAHLTKLFLPGMIQRRSGRILNVASTAAFVPGPFMAMYYATKSWVFSFTLAIAAELEGAGVTATALCPGPTVTGFFEAAGNAASNLLKGPTMTAAEVAKIGFDAMMAGKPEVIAGARNRWMIWGARFAPRKMLTAIAKKLNATG